jgi:hypothetical protein
VVATAVLYGASLFLPAFTFTFDNVEVCYGWEAVAVVPNVWWTALTYGLFEGDMWKAVVGVWNSYPPLVWVLVGFAWLPNPLLLFAVVGLLRGRRRVALVSSSLAVLLGLVVPLTYTLGRADDDHRIFVGYCLWLASLALPAVFSQVRAAPSSGRAVGVVKAH